MRGLLAAALLCASPLAAQDRMAPETCVASWNTLLDLVPAVISADRVIADLDGWCDATAVVIEADNTVAAYVNHVRWRGIDLERFTKDGLPPRSLQIQMDGLGPLPQTGDPVFDYLYGVQAKVSDQSAGMSVRWDGVQNALIVDDAHFAIGDVDAIRLSARIDGVNLTDAGTMATSLGAAGLRDLTVKLTFDRWFEEYALFIIGPAVLYAMNTVDQTGAATQDIEDRVEAAKQAAGAFIAQVPDGILGAQSRDALAALIGSLPHPRGTLDLLFSADPAVGAGRVMAVMGAAPDATPLDILERLFADTRLRVSWMAGEAVQ